MFSSSTRSLFQIQQGCQCSDLEASEDLKKLIEKEMILFGSCNLTVLLVGKDHYTRMLMGSCEFLLQPPQGTSL